MTVFAIRNEQDHERALKRISELWGAPEGSDDFYDLDALATLVDAYEARAYPTPKLSPVEVLRYAISDMGRTQSDLATLLGSRSRASEILKGVRPLTLPMIRAIHDAWLIPVELLIGEREAKRPARRRARRSISSRAPAEKFRKIKDTTGAKKSAGVKRRAKKTSRRVASAHRSA